MGGFVVLVLVGFIFLVLVGFAIVMSKFYRQVEQGKALIVNTMGKEPEVAFTGKVVYPIFNKAEVMDISVKTIKIDRRGKDGLICKDNIRADIEVTFFVRVNKTREDVIKVAQAIGCVRASDRGTLEELFSAKFAEALKTAGKQLDFVELYTHRHEFRDQIVGVIGRDLNGYVLEDVAIDYLEQTPLSSLDPSNILDAQGIRKITELTAIEHVLTNEFANNERKKIKKQDVEAAEAVLELERQQTDAQSRQQREIATVRAREAAETMKVQAEERLKSELARIKADEEIQVNEQNMNRQIEVAQKNRERVVGVEAERAGKDRELEGINREREVALSRIGKEKQLEVEKKAIADVVRQRIAVDKTVAEEEERIKTVRVIEEARRAKESTVIHAEGVAQEQVVLHVQEAQAAEQAAKFWASKEVTIATAELEAADRRSRAKTRLAEGILAESAAAGLAGVKVREADAAAIEKVGLAEARVQLEKATAQAQGEELAGQARVRVREAESQAVQKVGLAEAAVLREKGLADAQAIQARMTAEAAGLAEKARSMNTLEEPSRKHEEYRLKMEADRTVALESVRARREVAGAQAEVLGKALSNARIDIVGGDGAVFDRIVSAVGMGKAVDGFVGRSETARTLLKDYLDGDASLAEDLKQILSRPAISGDTVHSLTLSAVLLQLIDRSDHAGKAKLSNLLETAKGLGVDGVRLS